MRVKILRVGTGQWLPHRDFTAGLSFENFLILQTFVREDVGGHAELAIEVRSQIAGWIRVGEYNPAFGRDALLFFPGGRTPIRAPLNERGCRPFGPHPILMTPLGRQNRRRSQLHEKINALY